MEELNALESLGLTLPGPAYIFGAIIFGIIGLAAFIYGRKVDRAPLKWTGAALMFYPYVVGETWILYAAGTGLCIALYVYRK